MIKKILASLPDISRHKTVFLSGILFIILAVGVFFETSLLVLSYQENKKAEEEIQRMESYLVLFEDKTEKINRSPLRPVPVSKLDAVQSEILFRLQADRLNLVSLREQTKKKDTNGHIYEIDISGAYRDTLQFLLHFKERRTMIGLEQVKMEQNRGIIHTKLRYKIYTQPEK